MAIWPRKLEYTADVRPIYQDDRIDQVVVVGRVDRPGIVNSVEFIPGRTLAGQGTNYRQFVLYNRGSAGAGTVSVASYAMSATANSLSAGVPKTIPLASGSALSVSPNDILEWQSVHISNGLPDPGGQVVVRMAAA